MNNKYMNYIVNINMVLIVFSCIYCQYKYGIDCI